MGTDAHERTHSLLQTRTQTPMFAGNQSGSVLSKMFSLTIMRFVSLMCVCVCGVCICECVKWLDDVTSSIYPTLRLVVFPGQLSRTVAGLFIELLHMKWTSWLLIGCPPTIIDLSDSFILFVCLHLATRFSDSAVTTTLPTIPVT